jgi:hypothetical protein
VCSHPMDCFLKQSPLERFEQQLTMLALWSIKMYMLRVE